MMWKVAPALATGNAVVLNQSEVTPLSALKFAELVKEAGFPDGVFNVRVSALTPRARATAARTAEADLISRFEEECRCQAERGGLRYVEPFL